MIYIEVGLLIVLLCLSAFASASEVALFSLSPNQIKTIYEKDSRKSRSVVRLRTQQEFTLPTILILNNLVNICIVILSSNVIDRLFTFTAVGWSFAVKTVAATFVLLLFGEIIPKIFAQRNPDRIAMFAAVPLNGFRVLFKPLSLMLVGIGRLINRGAHNDVLSMDELSDALDVTTPDNQQEREMLSEIVEFAQTEVREIMHHRPDVVAINIESDFEQVKRTIISSGFSRIPVYRESIDHIEGVLYIKDLVEHIGAESGFEWQKWLRQAYFIPERKKINDLLEEFRASRVHLAIVVDEYGSTLGVVSLEDVLEEIVGEIVDESDVEHTFYTKLDDNRWLFDGKTVLSDFFEVVQVNDGRFAKFHNKVETLAGLLLEIKGDFLREDESVELAGLRFTVKEINGWKIDKIEVVRIDNL